MEEKSISKKDAAKKIYGSLGFALLFAGLIAFSLISQVFTFNLSKVLLIGVGIFFLVNKKTRKWAIIGGVVYFAITHGVISGIMSRIPWKLVIYGLLAWGAIKLLSKKKASPKKG